MYKLFSDSKLAFPDMTAFLAAIKPLSQCDQVRVVALVLCGDKYQELITDPTMQEWIKSNANFVSCLEKGLIR